MLQRQQEQQQHELGGFETRQIFFYSFDCSTRLRAAAAAAPRQIQHQQQQQQKQEHQQHEHQQRQQQHESGSFAFLLERLQRLSAHAPWVGEAADLTKMLQSEAPTAAAAGDHFASSHLSSLRLTNEGLLNLQQFLLCCVQQQQQQQQQMQRAACVFLGAALQRLAAKRLNQLQQESFGAVRCWAVSESIKAAAAAADVAAAVVGAKQGPKVGGRRGSDASAVAHSRSSNSRSSSGCSSSRASISSSRRPRGEAAATLEGSTSVAAVFAAAGQGEGGTLCALQRYQAEAADILNMNFARETIRPPAAAAVGPAATTAAADGGTGDPHLLLSSKGLRSSGSKRQQQDAAAAAAAGWRSSRRSSPRGFLPTPRNPSRPSAAARPRL
ncbi:hypothetical protein Esti_000790 [Eimeria stiedai]